VSKGSSIARSERPALATTKLSPRYELALRFIGWQLADINIKNGGRLRWLDEQLPKEWAQQEQSLS
jgi:hypothetical protein